MLATYFLMNKLFFILIFSISKLWASCPDYSVPLAIVEKHLVKSKTLGLKSKGLVLDASCSNALDYAQIRLLIATEGYNYTPIYFELVNAFSKEDAEFNSGNKFYKVAVSSKNPLLPLVALIEGSRINELNKVAKSALSLMVKIPMPKVESPKGITGKTSGPKQFDSKTKIGSSADSSYDYYLITDQNSTHSKIVFENSRIAHKARASRPYSLKGPLHPKDLEVFNNDLKELILYFEDDLNTELTKQVNIAAQDLISDTKDDDIQVLEFLEFKHNLLDATPGIDLVDGNTVELAYPAGESGIYLKVKFRVRAQTKYFRKTTNISVTIKNLKVSNLIHVSPQEDGSVEVTIPNEVKVKGSVDIDFSNDILNLIISAIEKTFDPLSKKLREVVADTLKEDLKEDLEKLVNASKNPFGKEMEILAPYSAPVENKEQIIQKIEDKMFRHHLADSTLQNPVLRNEDKLTWKDYQQLDLDSLEYDRATIGMDGAIWTGTFLTSMALKYSVTQSGQDLERIQLLLDKINVLATVNGAGPLSRSAIPESSRWYEQLEREGRLQTFRSKLIEGEYWHSFQGYQGVSRDQYMGVMTGLINTFMYVHDPHTRDKAKRIFKHLLDYLIHTNWIVFEDHPGNLFDESEPRTLPAHYAGIGLHKLTYLLAGKIMFPEDETYQAQYIKYLPLAKMVWFLDFISSLEPLDEYYNYNLKHTLYLTLSNILEDEQLQGHFSKGIKIFEHYIGHHKNPYFSAIRYVTAQSFGIDLDFYSMKEEIHENYNGAFYRAHNMGMATEDEKELAKIYSDKLTIAYTLSGEKRYKVPAAIPPRFRNYSLDFLWQRDPFTPLNINSRIKRGNIAGLDMHIMYWLLRAKDIR